MDNPISAVGGGMLSHPAFQRLPGVEKTATFSPEVGTATGAGADAARPADFGKLLTQFIDGVNDTQKLAEMETRKVLLGETDNLHQAMIAGEQSSIAFRLMVEVRNKLVEGFQEVMRMQV